MIIINGHTDNISYKVLINWATTVTIEFSSSGTKRVVSVAHVYERSVIRTVFKVEIDQQTVLYEVLRCLYIIYIHSFSD